MSELRQRRFSQWSSSPPKHLSLRTATPLLIHVSEGSSHLILLFKSIALSSLHLGDVLQQVGHSDGWLELPPGVGHFHRLAAPVRVGLDSQGWLGHLSMATVCFKDREAKQAFTYLWVPLSFLLHFFVSPPPHRLVQAKESKEISKKHTLAYSCPETLTHIQIFFKSRRQTQRWEGNKQLVRHNEYIACIVK